VRIYVDPEDGLAMNVGAGHLTSDGLPMPNVYFINDGNLSGATEAHTTYDNPQKYANLPEELQTLPFQADMRYWEHARFPLGMAAPQRDGIKPTSPTPIPVPGTAPTPPMPTSAPPMPTPTPPLPPIPTPTPGAHT
jgi:hypothetical protein